MAINPEIRDQAYRFFVEEAPELLQAIETGLLTLRQERNPATIHAIMRSAHSIKGGAASVGLEGIKTIAHRLETIFRALYSDQLEVDPYLESQLLQAYDCLRIPLTEQITQGFFDIEQSLAAAEPILSQLEAQCQQAIVETENFIPGSADLGIDIAASIFEIDVAAGLTHLEQILEQPQNFEIVGELRAQTEVFLGFAELLNLPGFATIAQTVIEAIDRAPDRALMLTQLALADFQSARDAILAGDSVSIHPSAALLAFTQAYETSETLRQTDNALSLESLADFESSYFEPRFESGVELSSELLNSEFQVEPNAKLNGQFSYEFNGASSSELNDQSNNELDDELNDELSNELSNELNRNSNIQEVSEFNFTSNTKLAEELSEAEIEAIVQQELLQSEADFLIQESHSFEEMDDPSLETHTLTSENRLELESIFTGLAPSFDERFIERSEESSEFNEEIQLEESIESENKLDLSENQKERKINILEESGEINSDILSYLNLDIPSDKLEESEFNFLDSLPVEDTFLKTSSDIPSNTPQETSSEAPLDTSLNAPSDGSPDRSLDKPPAQMLENSPTSPASVTVKLPQPSRPQPAAYPAANSLTVRVDVDRLERLNNLLGELTINRNGLTLQTDQTRLTLREMRNRFERIQATIDQIRTLSDQMLITPHYSAGGASTYRQSLAASQAGTRSLLENSFASNLTTFKEFDSLEMDRYTTLYSSTQTLLEEMAQIEEAVEDIVLFNRQSQQTLEQQRKMLSQMQDDLMWARMLPLGDVLNRFPRILRDLSNTYDKPIDLFLSGTDLLIDKAVLEKLYDPLLHLLRNSFDHGIESAELRRERGKSPTGRIEIQAISRGRQVVIEVRDDGQGLDVDRIRQRAIDLDWMTPAEAEAASEAHLCQLIFAPGFSTATQVSDLSGRGMGLDVVREQLQWLKGSVTVRSTPAQGTTFILTLPLTLTITNLLIGLVNSRPIALRSDGIREILIPQSDQVTETETGRYLEWQEQQVPIYRMADLLTYHCVVPELPPSRVLAAVPAPSNWESPLVIFKSNQQAVALQIDRLVVEQEFVVKSFGSAIAPPDYTYGCTVLGDGMLVPVIDGQMFLEGLLNPTVVHPAVEVGIAPQHPGFSDPITPIRQTQATTVLVVDDALTSRRILALSLERAGYRVLQARDGQEALEQLQQSQGSSSGGIELIISDIEMPNMNGFELLTHRRQNADLLQIPIIMLTSRSNDKHRWLATQLGATAYFTKPYLEQEFLKMIEGLIGNKASVSEAEKQGEG